MGIAAITLTYNDDYKLDEWISHYNDYKDQLSYYVVVDNGSNEAFKQRLREAFPKAILIFRETNGGCTGAYNDAVRYLLNNTDVEAIAIIGNDMKLEHNCLKVMYDYLFSDERLGMVSTVLLKKDTDNSIESFGVEMRGFRAVFMEQGNSLEELGKTEKIVDIVPGGFNMAKRSFYEKAGLLDGNLFMYSEELDTMYRSRKAGFICGVTSMTYAWHWHINHPQSGQMRWPETRYMIGRNKVYLTKKYEGWYRSLLCLLFVCVIMSAAQLAHYLRSFDRAYLENARYTFSGGIHGFKGDMTPNSMSLPRIEENVK